MALAMILNLRSYTDPFDFIADSVELSDMLQPFSAESSKLKASDNDCHSDESQSKIRWSHIAHSLSQHPIPRHIAMPEHRLRKSEETPPDMPYESRHITVSLLERPTSSTVLVSWHDPQQCSYNYQLWRQSSSRTVGICALSGQRIDLGQSVYKPFGRKTHVMNSKAMILAHHVEMLSVADAEPNDISRRDTSDLSSSGAMP